MSNPTQLSFVSLQVSDLEASCKFYTEILNFSRFYNPRLVF
ncbi:MAG: VOC family protein [Bacteroidota bacterium]|nr:VOC family protein [Bacteroidota bacterium]